MSKEINFDDAPESKQYKSLDKAGVHRKLFLVEVEFVEQKEKTKKDKEGKEVGTGEFVGPYAKFVFRSEEPAQQFVTTMFQPPTKETEVKFFGDYYEKGVPIRKKTATEQIQGEFLNKYYHYEQLAKALQISPENFAKYKSATKGAPDILFKLMFEKFFALFPLEKLKTRAIDLKTIWNNNNRAKTSFLQLAYPSASNLVFAPHIEGRDSFLSIMPNEMKMMNRQFSPHDRAPSTNATEAGGSNEYNAESSDAATSSEGGYKSIVGADEPLF